MGGGRRSGRASRGGSGEVGLRVGRGGGRGRAAARWEAGPVDEASEAENEERAQRQVREPGRDRRRRKEEEWHQPGAAREEEKGGEREAAWTREHLERGH